MADNTHINGNGKRSTWSEEEEDRLSSLPDEILIQILSLLPFLLVAQTSLLSRRWRYLWKSITNFEFQTLVIDFQTVHKSLQHLTSPKIRVFDYSYSLDDEDDNHDYYRKHFQSHVNAAESCYHLIVRRNVEVLRITSFSKLPVSKCVFTCESLVDLRLDVELYLNFELDMENDPPVINLPNLKKLLLRFDHYLYCFLRTLLKFCPHLEDLCLVLITYTVDVLEVFGLNLKYLTIINSVIAPYSEVVIDAPKLAILKIWDMCSYYNFRMVPASLVEASFNLRIVEDPRWHDNYKHHGHDWTVESHARSISNFFRGMSSVSSLELQCFSNMHMFLGSADDGDMAVFYDLTFFKAKLDSVVGWEDLLCSLHCFPNLKHLELIMDGFYFWGRSRWFAPVVLPDCLLSKLKKITLNKIKGTTDEIKLIELILNHADVLEELFIYAPTGPVTIYELTQLWTEYKFCEALFNRSRS